MRSMFNKQVVAIQGSPVELRPLPTLLCYVVLVFGLYHFIIREKKSVFQAYLLGLVIYAVYETTTLALLKKWSYKTAVIDTLWGGVLFSLTTLVFYSIQRRYKLK